VNHFHALKSLLEYAEANSPGTMLDHRVKVLPLGKMIRQLRQAKNPHRVNGHGATIRMPGAIVLEAPPEMIDNLKLPDEQSDLYYIVRVRRSVADRLSSAIVLPGEVKPS